MLYCNYNCHDLILTFLKKKTKLFFLSIFLNFKFLKNIENHENDVDTSTIHTHTHIDFKTHLKL
jgi:hypothetical protein